MSNILAFNILMYRRKIQFLNTKRSEKTTLE